MTSTSQDRGPRDLSSRLAALSPAQRALLEKRLQRYVAAPALEAIQPRVPSAVIPLSFGQRRLWILQQWEADLAAYNMSLCVDLEGHLDVAALARSLTEIVRRHEVLRTTFAPNNGEAVQVVNPPQPAVLAQRDLGSMSEAEAGVEAARLAEAEGKLPFDLAHGPLLRSTLLRIAPERHRLLICMHHIVSDAWSMGLLQRELSELYAAFAAGRPSPLPDLPIQYGDYAIWQRRDGQARALDSQLTYWTERLRGLVDFELPTDYPRPPALTFRGAREEVRLDAVSTQALRDLGRAKGATLFMVALAAMQTLLARYTGQNDVVVGSPVAGRTRSELDGLIGFFINMLVLRADTSGNPPFQTFLGQVRETALAAFAHQELPFDRLVETLRLQRAADRSPLFNVAFVMQNAPATSLTLPGLRAHGAESFSGWTRYDLEVHLHDHADGLRGRFIFNRDLFHPFSIRRMARAFQVLLGAIATDPSRRLRDLPLLTAAERSEVLAAGEPPVRPFHAEQSIQERLAMQAAATPDAVALESGAARMTYGELDRRANALACQLRACGVEAGTPVGVCADRSPAMVVAWLAALKAGGAYLPLDTTFPVERLATMLQDSGARAVLFQSHHRALIPEGVPGLVCLALEAEALDATGGGTGGVSGPTAGGDAPAYVVFTSGSTGRPKGVVVPHRAVNRLVLNTDYIQLGPSDVVAQMSSCTFDAATFEVWGALLNGARLTIIDSDYALSPAMLGPELRRRGVTALFVPTALFHMLVRHEPAVFAGVRQVLFGGEECDPQAVRTVLDSGGAPERLLHVYGPTETTTFATWHLVLPDQNGRRRVPIGQPIANTAVYLLDDNLAPVPAGAVGEIYIGGPGVALGYLGDAVRTAEVFVQNPFDPGTRLYRTGDRGRQDADGRIEFLGRADQQVKIRGYRVEPGEVEVVLRGHPMVRDAVVSAVQGPAGDRCLVAYVVTREADVAAVDWGSWLRRSLPPYMLPVAYVMLPALPLTTHGKVDRHALPPPVFGPPVAASGNREPRNGEERQLLAVWRDVLGLPRMGIHDNFFDAGGHSLTGVNLMARIRAEFGVALPLRTLFDAPTVADMAARLSSAGGTTPSITCPVDKRLVTIQPGRPGHPALFIVPGGKGGEREFTIYARVVRKLDPAWPVYGFLARGRDGVEAPHRNVDEMVADYEDTLRNVQPHGPYALVGDCLGGLAAHALACRLRAAGEAIVALVLMDTIFPAPREHRRHLWRRFGARMRSSLKNISAAPVRARLAWTRLEVEELASFAWGVWGPAIANRRPSNARARDWHIHCVFHAYPAALLRYKGSPYPGALDLLVSDDFNRTEIIEPWRRFATGGMRVHAMAGNHETYVRDESDSLGRTLARILAAAVTTH